MTKATKMERTWRKADGSQLVPMSPFWGGHGTVGVPSAFALCGSEVTT